MTRQPRKLEKAVAVASFVVAVALAFLGILISEDHDIAANTMFVIAQFLTLTATILGIDYKFNPSSNLTTNPTPPIP